MYDALVALRSGWGRSDFATASPELMSAMRADLYVERLMPEIEESKRVVAIDPADVAPKDRPKVNKARADAAKRLTDLRVALALEEPKRG